MADPILRGTVLEAADAESWDSFGRSVALSADGKTLVVGASSWEGAAADQGGVYTYDWNGSAWVQRGAVLTSADAGSGDTFGISVALSADGSVLVVGAYAWEGGVADQGGVYSYDRNGSSWVQRGSVLVAADAAASDGFGESVALSADGTVLAVGASSWEGTLTDQGGVYVYDLNGSSWVQRGAVLTAPSGVYFGVSVTLSPNGSVLAVGEGGYGATYQGGVYIYDRDGSSWVQRGAALTAQDAADYDFFGSTVSFSLDGTTLVVGAYGKDAPLSDQGAAYIYDWNGSSWVQRGALLTAFDGDSLEYFGMSAAFSADGSVLVVGASGWRGLFGQGGVYVYDVAASLFWTNLRGQHEAV